jgi:hypothetical protein
MYHLWYQLNQHGHNLYDLAFGEAHAKLQQLFERHGDGLKSASISRQL